MFPQTDAEREARSRALRLNAESANRAHADGRHGPGAVLADRKAWAALGCTACAQAVAR